MFAGVAELEKFTDHRVMVIAHREELIRQAAHKIEIVTGERPTIDMADEVADATPWYKSRIVVSSVQTANAKRNQSHRMEKFDPNAFGLLIIDEAHHAPAATYGRCIDWFRRNDDLRVLGVTATPDRTDEVALGKVFGSVAYRYEIFDAIHDGWLVPIVQHQIELESLDFSSIRTTAGDLNGADLSEVMQYERNLHGVARPTYELAKGRKTLMFCASVAHAERTCEIFNRYEPACAAFVSGKTPKDERRQITGDFAAGRFQFLCNCGVFTEGYDEPSIECVSMGRPTKSRSLYAQMVGRGTRANPSDLIDGVESDGRQTETDIRRSLIRSSDKPYLEVFDFVGNSGRHKLISTSDILGGNYEAEVVTRAAAQSGDVLANLEQAKHDVDAERALAEKQRLAREARDRARREKIVVKAKYAKKTIDPFDTLDITPPVEQNWNRGKAVTPKMRELLERNGIDSTELNYAEAKAMVGTLMARWRSGLATLRQASCLKRAGYDIDGVTNEQASRMIDALAANNWQRPTEPTTDERQEEDGQGKQDASLPGMR